MSLLVSFPNQILVNFGIYHLWNPGCVLFFLVVSKGTSPCLKALVRTRFTFQDLVLFTYCTPLALLCSIIGVWSHVLICMKEHSSFLEEFMMGNLYQSFSFGIRFQHWRFTLWLDVSGSLSWRTDQVRIDECLCRWVPIQGNDWYHIRDTIKVGMKVQVEVLVIGLSLTLIITSAQKVLSELPVMWGESEVLFAWVHRPKEIHIDFGFRLRCDSWTPTSIIWCTWFVFIVFSSAINFPRSGSNICGTYNGRCSCSSMQI